MSRKRQARTQRPTELGWFCVSDFPQLKRLSWHVAPETKLSPLEILSHYERNWRHVDVDTLGTKEKTFIDFLVRTVGKGHFLV
jgi:hypothetical protein